MNDKLSVFWCIAPILIYICVALALYTVIGSFNLGYSMKESFPPRKPPVYIQADCYVDGSVINPVSELHFLTEGDL